MSRPPTVKPVVDSPVARPEQHNLELLGQLNSEVEIIIPRLHSVNDKTYFATFGHKDKATCCMFAELCWLEN